MPIVHPLLPHPAPSHPKTVWCPRSVLAIRLQGRPLTTWYWSISRLAPSPLPESLWMELMGQRPPRRGMFFRAHSDHNPCPKTEHRKTVLGRRRFLLLEAWLQVNSRASPSWVIASRQSFQTPEERYLAGRLRYWDWRSQG